MTNIPIDGSVKIYATIPAGETITPVKPSLNPLCDYQIPHQAISDGCLKDARQRELNIDAAAPAAARPVDYIEMVVSMREECYV